MVAVRKPRRALVRVRAPAKVTWGVDGGSRLGMYDGGGQGGGFRAEPPPIARAAEKMACFGDLKGHFH